MADSNQILKEALNLTPAEKAKLIDKLLSSLDKTDKEHDELWAREAEDFHRRHRGELNRKKLALFASTMKTMAEREGKTEQVAKTRRKALDDRAAKHGLHPCADPLKQAMHVGIEPSDDRGDELAGRK